MSVKELIVVGGPNGAGKSTFVAKLLSEQPCPYLCADVIAHEFSHLNPVSQQIMAGREFLRRLDEQLVQEGSFVVESTLAGRTLRSFLANAKAAGFNITIWFIYLDSAETCVARVRQRVLSGGHDVPEDDIRRRFNRSLANFWHIYREIADNWYTVYNSGSELIWIASGEPSAQIVHDQPKYLEFLRLIGVLRC